MALWDTWVAGGGWFTHMLQPWPLLQACTCYSLGTYGTWVGGLLLAGGGWCWCDFTGERRTEHKRSRQPQVVPATAQPPCTSGTCNSPTTLVLCDQWSKLASQPSSGGRHLHRLKKSLLVAGTLCGTGICCTGSYKEVLAGGRHSVRYRHLLHRLIKSPCWWPAQCAVPASVAGHR